ncbi:MAG: ATP-dependent protease subunit HslV [Clostridiales bacterium]|jgi:ATP-dependent HslUV protease subunit HslV|nr:ATP-dependent protease subunit HslV [Clostridiales bacterium]
MTELLGTTIVAVRKNGKTAIAGDGQVTSGQSVVLKNNAVKVRRIYNDKVIIGFAGSVADAFTLEEHFEEMLQRFSGHLMRSSVELARLWRNDKMLRKLEAMMIVADETGMFILSGVGDVVDPEDGICAIGSGGNYALAAARALARETKLGVKEIAKKAIQIASEICVFTNGNIIVEEV